MRWDVGIDLGTRCVRMTRAGDGSLLSQAAAIAVDPQREHTLCALDAAYALYGREHERAQVCFPISDGTLRSAEHARALLACLYAPEEAQLARRRRERVLLTCAPFSRPVQREALLRAALDAGAGEAALLRSDAAVAVGAGLNILAPEASLLVDVGAGKISATLFTRGLVAAYAYLPYGVLRIDERIARMLRTERGYAIGPKTAEEIKQALAAAHGGARVPMRVAGLSLQSRMPELFDVDADTVLRACEGVVVEMLGMAASVVDNAPEELAADLNDTGCVLAGGGALLSGLDKRMGDHLGIPCRVADAPQVCGGAGLAKIMEDPQPYETLFLETMKAARH